MSPLKSLLIAVFLVAFTCSGYTQKIEIPKEFKKKYEEGFFYFQYDDYHQAFPFFLEIYLSDSTIKDVNFRLGVCYFYTMRDFTDARKLFEYCVSDFPESYYYLGRIYHRLGLFDKAIEAFTNYKNRSQEWSIELSLIDHYIDISIVAKQLVSSKSNVVIKNIGPSINSPWPDYVPVISSDNSYMLFTSRREGSTGNKKDPNGEYFEDIYMTTNKLGVWTDPVNMGSPINTESHDACVSLTQDGQQLFMYRTNKELTGGDIYVTKREGDKWRVPSIIEAEINTTSGLETSICLSPDETVLYFSSNRPGGYGGMDLYYVKRLPNGEWGLAKNMGPVINSPYDEDAPFIHPDGKTLFFSSKGHRNMGDFDIFKSVLLEDDVWSAPENMGYPLNSVSDDIYYVVTADRKNAYFSSNRAGGLGGADIYTATMPENAETQVLLRGTVTTNEPVFSTVKATITLIDLVTKDMQGIYRTNKKTGKYLMVLLPGKKYKMVIEAEGFHSVVDEIDLTKRLNPTDLNKHINMERIVKERIDPIQSELDSIKAAQSDSLKINLENK